MEGKLKVITSKSGHYKPGKDEMLRALATLRPQGVVDPFAVVYPDLTDGMNRWYGANEWFDKHGVEDKFDNPRLTKQQVLNAIPQTADKPRDSVLPLVPPPI